MWKNDKCSFSVVELMNDDDTGLLRVVKQQVKVPVHVMIRPRAGDFHYSDQEMDVMRTDIKILKENGADGFVFGLLHRLVSF